MNKKLCLMLIVFGVFTWGVNIFAGTTGKISGTVTDAQNGAPLPGVNVMIEGTSIGAATDLNGFYFIINIPPGNYTVSATMMGYKTISKTGVKLLLTLRQNLTSN